MHEAHTSVTFADAPRYFPVFLDALEDHQLPVERIGYTRAFAGHDREISLTLNGATLDIAIRSSSPETLNALRYSVTSLIGFNAHGVAPELHWAGTRTGDTQHPDMQIFTVQEAELLTPKMRRIWFAGADVHRYDTLTQLHARLFFGQGSGLPRLWPVMTDQGQIRWPEGEDRLDTRVYTIRDVDFARNRLAVDFYLGDHAGPATAWASRAQPGDGAGFIGPAARGLVPARFHVFAGDETGLPGIARCLAALPDSAQGTALIEVNGPKEVQSLAAPTGMDVKWMFRRGQPPGTTRLLAEAFSAISWPEDRDTCAFWCGAERMAFLEMNRAAKALGLPRKQIVAFAHWRIHMSEPEIAAAGSASIREAPH